jgi:fumarylacetoacetase
MALDDTHDAARRSWVATSPESDFPIQNLPLGIADGRLSTAIGDRALDLANAAEAGLLTGAAADIARGDSAITARPRRELTELRHQLARLLDADAEPHPELLKPLAHAELSLPCRIGSYTDFYAGIHHARAVTAIIRPGADLAPNYKWMPVAYNGRSTTVRASGALVARPHGQQRTETGDPVYAPTRKLDFELELGFYVGPPTTAGEPVAIADAEQHIAGFCLLNDWSARDIQMWETVPLGPFLGKSFATTVSPWVVTLDALEPFRATAERPDDDPKPLPHLDDLSGGLAIELAVELNGEVVVRSDARHLYWTPAQMLAHHTSNGCDLETGDLLGTGTISGPEQSQSGSLLELTKDGSEGGGYLKDGDTVTLKARCVRGGYATIGFGDCSGTIVRKS